ncbi:hypothetical protein [Bartonella sp. HY761]|uniref:hypothetical protein n=1 Tax=Bartonella sp. HY761 TaxID=2979330 RepID=UPI00220393DD|nr:hypothetical protein [Bartonella sp. HY761]UXN06857.1 hypothetical protein N6A79_02285 [Bartonella sp. HY761]
MKLSFEIGKLYNRREDIHKNYGGQQQSGIITPQKHPLIFLITSTNGKKHGYHDYWENEIFHYYGEGQTGDMTLTRGNKAIAEHEKNKKTLLLFKTEGENLIFEGKFTYVNHRTEFKSDDINKDGRNVIIFALKSVEM